MSAIEQEHRPGSPGPAHREELDRYRTIFESTIDGLVVIELDGTVFDANTAFCEMFGCSRDELIGRHVRSLSHPDEHPAVAARIEGINEGDPAAPIRRSRAIRKDGSVFYSESRSRVFDDVGRKRILTVVRDVTEQIEAEHQLREREEQYRSIFDSSVDGIAMSDLDGYVVEANPAYCRMWGYTRDEMIGVHGSALMHPDSIDLVREALETTRAGGSVYRAGVAVRKDGTVFQVEGRTAPFTFRDTPHVMTVARDVTERIEAEQQLREKEDQYRRIFESSVDAIIIADLDGYVVEVSPAACQMYGYVRDEMVGLSAAVLLAPESLDVMREAMETIKAGGTINRMAVAVRKDGTPFHVEGPTVPFTFREKPHAMSVVRDVTQRVAADQQLREREEQYRSIFEASGEALIIGDLKGFIVEANPAACQIYGYTREELIGMHSDEITRPDYRAEIPQAAQATVAGGIYDTRAVSIRKDGSPFYVDARGAGFMYKGEPHVLGVMRDVTELVRAQEELERRVEERTRELSTLLDVSRNVASTLELPRLLDLILEQLQAVVPYTDASILEVDGEELQTIGNRGPLPPDVLFTTRFPFGPRSPTWPVIREARKVIIEDLWSDGSIEAQGFREAAGKLLRAMGVSSWLAVPLVVGERIIGAMTVAHKELHYYTMQHADLAGAIAQQAAIAIENARLFERVQETAILEERQRLSRELHDSVSQALYSIALGAKTARALLDRNPAGVADPLDFVLAQAERGLAEMRALIFELRPEALEQEGLASALRKQAAALQARHQLQIDTSLCQEPETPAPVKEALYRIAQEALQNIIKHAHATHVQLVLTYSDDELALEVRDNGTGFNPGDTFPGHLGLRSMRERAARLGGALELESASGTGTVLKACVPRRGRGVSSTARDG